MTPIILYSIMLSVFLVTCIRRKTNVIGIILVISYTVVSYFSLVAADKPLLQYSTTISSEFFSYGNALFLIVVLFIFFKPFLIQKKDFNENKITYSLNQNFLPFAWIYIGATLYSIGLYLPRAISSFQSGSWAFNRSALMAGENEAIYSNALAGFLLNFSGYFMILALIVGFIMIKEAKYKKTGIAIIASILISELSRDIYLSTRGLLVEFVLLVLALYLFFYSDIDKGTRRFVSIISIAAAVVIIPYLIDVTVSRFMGSAQNSVIYYLGQPPLVFGLETTEVEQPMLGRFAFGVLLGDEKFPLEMSNWVHGFYTFVGWLYADWGYIGTLLIGFIFMLAEGKVIRKANYCISDLFFIFAPYNILLQGTFTIGRTKCYELISYIVIYWLLRFVLEKYVFTIGGKTFGMQKTTEKVSGGD